MGVRVKLLGLFLLMCSIYAYGESHLGIWVWYLPDTRYETPAKFADYMKEKSIKRAYVKVNDELGNSWFTPYMTKATTDAFKNKGLEVWAWGYNYPSVFTNNSGSVVSTSIENQAKAVYNAAKAGYQGYVLDAEMEFNQRPSDFITLCKRAYEYKQQAIREGYATTAFKLYVAPMGNPKDHVYLSSNIRNVNQYLDGYMPQTYLEVWGTTYMNSPETWVNQGTKDFKDLGATKPIHHILSDEKGLINSATINKAFKVSGNESSLWRFPNDDNASLESTIVGTINAIDWKMFDSTEIKNLRALEIKQSGTTLNVIGVIKNEGNVELRNFGITLRINMGVFNKRVDVIRAGETKEIVFATNLTRTGSYNSSILVDSEAEIKESNESDNKLEKAVIISGNNPSNTITLNIPQTIKVGVDAVFSGTANGEIRTVKAKVDNYDLTIGTNNAVSVVNGAYSFKYKFSSAGNGRVLKVLGLNAAGVVVKEESRTINIIPASINDAPSIGTISYTTLPLTVNTDEKVSVTIKESNARTVVRNYYMEVYAVRNNNEYKIGNLNVSLPSGTTEKSFVVSLNKFNTSGQFYTLVKLFNAQGGTLKTQRKGASPDNVEGGSVNRKVLDVPFYDQPNSVTCGPTSVTMALKYLGENVNANTIWDVNNRVPSSVQSPEYNVQEFQRWGLYAKGTRTGNRDMIIRQIDAGRPVVLHTYLTGGHVVLVVGYDKDRGGFIINDPWGKYLGTRGSYDNSYGIGKNVFISWNDANLAVRTGDTWISTASTTPFSL